MKYLEISETYLSKSKFKKPLLFSFFLISLIGIVSSFYWENLFNIREYFFGERNLIFLDGEYYRALFLTFVHSDLNHYLSNSYSLFFLFILHYSYFGPIKIFTLDLIFVFLSNLISIYTYDEGIHLIGASGLVYLLAGSYLTLYVLIDRYSSFQKRIFRSFAVALIIFWPQTLMAQVSYRAHFFGFVAGIIEGICYYLFKRSYFLSYEKWREIIEEDEEDTDPIQYH